MAQFSTFCKAASEFADIADFVNIYIEEAHPLESFNFHTNPHQIPVHRMLQNQLAAAKQLASLHNTNAMHLFIIVDNMDNKASQLYAGFPMRLHIVLDNNIVHVGGIAHDYNVQEAVKWLQKFKKEN